MIGASDTPTLAEGHEFVDSPRQSFLPIALGVGVTILLVGLLASRPVLALGALVVLVTSVAWIARLVGDAD